MLQFTKGNMFDTPADIRVNTVNCVGVMGAGVALAFKQRFPEMFKEYKRYCESGVIQPGKLHVWKNLAGDWVVNFPTKRHWKQKSKYEDVELGLIALRKYLEELGNVRVTLPALGSGHGGLDWSIVSEMIRQHLDGLEAEIIVFDPSDSRDIVNLQNPDSSCTIWSIAKNTCFLPQFKTNSSHDEIHYQGDINVFKNANLTIALSQKPAEKEEMIAMASINELPKRELTLCLLLGNATATKLATAALKQGICVAAWIPQGLSHYRAPKVLQEASQYGNLLLLSLAKPQQAWNPKIANQSRLASLISAKITLVTDPEPNWLSNFRNVNSEKCDNQIFYIRYQSSEKFYQSHLKWISAKAIGRRFGDDKPNLTPILEALRGESNVQV